MRIKTLFIILSMLSACTISQEKKTETAIPRKEEIHKININQLPDTTIVATEMVDTDITLSKNDGDCIFNIQQILIESEIITEQYPAEEIISCIKARISEDELISNIKINFHESLNIANPDPLYDVLLILNKKGWTLIDQTVIPSTDEENFTYIGSIKMNNLDVPIFENYSSTVGYKEYLIYNSIFLLSKKVDEIEEIDIGSIDLKEKSYSLKGSPQVRYEFKQL